ncbi:MAG: NADH-quinone oxidoreductase subunit I [Candidatus Calescibacterium sp.]|nr:NADH-quinone oxidoreductase subunit I [Candidatus Calescibacterium sp.]
MEDIIIPEGTKVKNVERDKISFFEKAYASISGGFKVTLEHLFGKKVTLRYPEERKELPKNYRGRHYLDIEKCVACEFCAAACPVDIIFIVGEPHPEKVRHPRVFNIDILKCIFCGYCVEACPTGALQMTDVYEVFSPQRFILTIDELSKIPEFKEFKE